MQTLKIIKYQISIVMYVLWIKQYVNQDTWSGKVLNIICLNSKLLSS